MTGCSGSASPGILALEAWGMKRWGVGTLGTYNCRNVAGTDTLSKHGLGLAWDAAVQAPSPVGDEVFAWCVEHAAQLGLTEAIWKDRAWFGAGVRPYSKSDHLNHVHLAIDHEHGWTRPLSPEVLDQIAGGPPGARTGDGGADTSRKHRAGHDGPLAGLSALVQLLRTASDPGTWLRFLKVLAGAGLIVVGVLLTARDSLLDAVPPLRKVPA